MRSHSTSGREKEGKKDGTGYRIGAHIAAKALQELQYTWSIVVSNRLSHLSYIKISEIKNNNDKIFLNLSYYFEY